LASRQAAAGSAAIGGFPSSKSTNGFCPLQAEELRQEAEELRQEAEELRQEAEEAEEVVFRRPRRQACRPDRRPTRISRF
jgi:hypothetical protein